MAELPIEDEKSRVLQDLLDREAIEFAVLYGSQAIGDARPDSDIDIGLMFEDISRIEPYTIIFRIEEEYADAGFDDMELDLSVLNTAEEEDFLSTVREQALFFAGDEVKAEKFSS